MRDVRTNKQTREDRATQPMDHGRLRWAIISQFLTNRYKSYSTTLLSTRWNKSCGQVLLYVHPHSSRHKPLISKVCIVSDQSQFTRTRKENQAFHQSQKWINLSRRCAEYLGASPNNCRYEWRIFVWNRRVPCLTCLQKKATCLVWKLLFHCFVWR